MYEIVIREKMRHADREELGSVIRVVIHTWLPSGDSYRAEAAVAELLFNQRSSWYCLTTA
jgi:hypothetical protein